MCGRFASTLPVELLARAFGVAAPGVDFVANDNVGPGGAALVVRRDPRVGMRALDALQFGLLAHFVGEAKGAKRPFNARGETVARLPVFAQSFAARRCLVPVACWYEWRAEAGGKQPYAIAPTDGGMVALGGIWDGHRAADGSITRSFAIITVPASADLAHLHARMPLVVAAGDWAVWLGEVEGDARDLLHTAAVGMFGVRPVSRALNRAAGVGRAEPAPAADLFGGG